ncbi:hypothetical protein NLI96_g2663 [Meripilus lineatus]|uniref:Uncharacterized protein n=1 Tax=Meripilus lineatus TaxID=2056292 RepID=A0AAD5V881_9APHY|nr:hypothetical protein NLI96_g2663 [Physisporinus lineatus]
MPSRQGVPHLALVSILAVISTVFSIPVFEGISAWSSSIGSLVPGVTVIEAIGSGGTDPLTYVPLYMSTEGPRGSPGNVSVTRDPSPPLFYIANNELYHFHNESTILPIQVHNSTQSAKLPLQLTIGDGEATGKLSRRTIVPGGNWRWQGTMLRYDQGTTSTPLFFSCQDANGLMGLFLHPKPSPTPEGCTAFTLHSFSRVKYSGEL